MKTLAAAAVTASLIVAAGGAQAAEAAKDPFLFLEAAHSDEAMAWVGAENKRTLGVLEADPRFAAFNRDALAIGEAKDKIPSPQFLAGEIYNFWQDADHVRGLWRKTSLASYRSAAPVWSPVFDLDAAAAAAKANWVSKGLDCEGLKERRCLMALSDGGEDAVEYKEFDLASKTFVAGGFDLPKAKQRAAFEGEDQILIARAFKTGELTTSGYPFVVKRLKRGQSLDQAEEVFRGAASDGGYGVTPVTLTDGAGESVSLIIRPLTTFEAETYLVGPNWVAKTALPRKSEVRALFAGRLIVSIDEAWTSGGVSVPAGALVAFDLAAVRADPAALKPTVIFAPTARQSLGQVAAAKDALIVTTLDNVRGRASLYKPTATGWTATPVAAPDNVAVGLIDADPRASRAFLGITGFLTPSSVALVDTASAKLTMVKSTPARFDASRDVVEQLEAVSSDGVKIPYFLVRPKSLPMDGSAPTILTAYGGFQVSVTPRYSGVVGKLWLERGGVYVLANIRGGGEFGPAWHEAGLKTKRQIIYDDFAAVASDLIRRGVTSPRRLGIEGGSNGGLLMGVQFTQRPELFHAVDIQVPLLDMVRYEEIAAGTSWVGEYGSVSVPEERAFLEKISPYANLKPDVNYPEPMIWTTTKDDRVGPQHARKFAAKLKALGRPYLFYEVTEGGHGAGANLKETARTQALEMTYFTRKLFD